MMEKQKKWYYKQGETLPYSFVMRVNTLTVFWLIFNCCTVQGLSGPGASPLLIN